MPLMGLFMDLDADAIDIIESSIKLRLSSCRWSFLVRPALTRATIKVLIFVRLEIGKFAEN